MDEVRRLAYLSAMGIDCYVRREFRPETPIPVADQTFEAVTRESVGKNAQSSVSKLKSRRSETLVLEPVVQKNQPAPLESLETPSDQSHETEPDNEAGQLRFSLQVYRISEKLVVINEVPYLGLARTGKEVSNLLTAILRALGQELAELPTATRFNWPLSTDDDASRRREPEACQALEGFMVKRLDENFFDVVVVFGSQCEALFASSGVGQLLAESSNRVIHTHSLDAMLQVPTLKRSVWESIRVIPTLLE